MNRFKAWPSLALAGLAAVAVSALLQACGGAAAADESVAAASAQQSGAPASTGSHGRFDPIVGVWQSTLSVKDCASGAVLATAIGIGTFHEGGTFTADDSRPPSSHGAVMGTWQNEGHNRYSIQLVFMRFNPDQTLAGYGKSKATRTLSADGNSFTGELTRQTLDLAGNVLDQGCASDQGSRITW